jgi:hypothetical protein
LLTSSEDVGLAPYAYCVPTADVRLSELTGRYLDPFAHTTKEEKRTAIHRMIDGYLSRDIDRELAADVGIRRWPESGSWRDLITRDNARLSGVATDAWNISRRMVELSGLMERRDSAWQESRVSAESRSSRLPRSLGRRRPRHR